MSKKETAVAVKEETSLALPADVRGDWGNEDLEAKDVLIPRILLAQQMSEAVSENDIKPGQFYRSTDKKVYGGGKTSFSCLVIKQFKNWVIEVKKGDRFEFEKTLPYNPVDASLPWDFSEEGQTKRRNECFNFYVISLADIEAKEVFPSLLSFRRTQVSCAKAIISYMTLMKSYRAPSCSYVLDFTSTLKENDLGRFYIPEMKKGRQATVEEITICKQWFDAISHGNVKIAPEEGEATEVIEDAKF